MTPRLGNPELYTIAWIAALPIERAAATALLDEIHDEPDGFVQHETDNNSYSWGRIGEHNIVIASLQAGVYGTTSAATTASDLIHSLPHIRIGLLVGIGGGISRPDEDQDIRLGDIVVSQPDGTTGGVVQYDLGKAKVDGIWEPKGSLNKPPPVLLNALASLQAKHEMAPSKIPDLLEAMWNANNRFMTKGKRNYTYPGAENDRLFGLEYHHAGGLTCAKCDTEWELEREERESTDPEIHYGIIASGNSLIKDAATRDSLLEKSGHQFLCVEMEAAGLMDRFPCLVIRGICDYADSHKNDRWQRYAAATAAAFAVELLEHVPARQVQATRKVVEAIQSLEEKVSTLSVSVQNVDSNITLNQLPDAEGARFDSQAEHNNPTCLANTRVDLLNDLSSWLKDDASKPIMWLNGMAGTGKSTIARTVAKERYQLGDLGASFFFKRGEMDRGSLAKFVSSMARQLARSIPGFAPFVKVAIDADPDIVGKAVAKQFAELIEAPLAELSKTTTQKWPFAIIIDALDECEGEEEIKSLIHILTRANSIQNCLRILITSRPELPIRLGFATANNTYRALVLHNIPTDTIEHDILTFLVNEFDSIRTDFNSVVPEELRLLPNWPGVDAIKRLTKMAVPLFIFAATVCRFIKDYKVDSPSSRLNKYFQLSNNSYGTHLGKLYGPVLRSIVTDISGEDRRQTVEQLCHIVGSIVVLASPLSVTAVSKLLDVPVDVVYSRLNALHSVLNTPSSLHKPVRLLHISFRDYITDPSQNQKNEFWVDEYRTHLGLFRNSLRVMSDNLKENMCNLMWPGAERKNIPSERLAYWISDELQYACRHWVYHFQKLECPLLYNEEVLAFLQKHLYHWLEALSLIGRFNESFQAIRTLHTCITKNEQRNMYDELFLVEVYGFIKMNSTIIDLYPLQLYSSLPYSILDGTMLSHMPATRNPPWVQCAPKTTSMASRTQQILEGHREAIGHCCFSLDNSQLVSCSHDGTLRVWHLDTGECIRVIKHKERIGKRRPFKLSYDSSWVAIISNVFENESDEKKSDRGYYPHRHYSALPQFDLLRSHVVKGGGEESDTTSNEDSSGAERPRLPKNGFDTSSDEEKPDPWIIEDVSDASNSQELFEAHRSPLVPTYEEETVVGSHEDGFETSGSEDLTETWSVEDVSDNRNNRVSPRVYLAHNYKGGSVVGNHEDMFDTSDEEVKSETGSDEGASDASISRRSSTSFNSQEWPDPGFLKLWNVDAGEVIEELRLLPDYEQPFQFSPNSKLLAYIKNRETVAVLRLGTSEHPREICLEHSERVVSEAPYREYTKYHIEFSPDSSILTIMSSFTRSYGVWETKNFACIRYLKMNPFFQEFFRNDKASRESTSVAVTEDALIMVAGALSEGCWSFESREHGLEMKHTGKLEIRWFDSAVMICSLDCQAPVYQTRFSPDNRTLASICDDGTIRTWRVETGECLTLFESGEDPRTIALSPNFKKLSSGGETRTITVSAVDESEADVKPKGPSDPIESVALSPDHTLAATSSYNGVVKAWDMNTCHPAQSFYDSSHGRTGYSYGWPELFRFTSDNRYLFVFRTLSVHKKHYPYDGTIPYLDGRFRVWDMQTAENVFTSQTRIRYTPLDETDTLRGSAVSVAPNDEWIVSVLDRRMTIFAVGTFSVIHELALKGFIFDVAVSPDSKSCFVLSFETSTFGKLSRRNYVVSMISIAEPDRVVSIELLRRIRSILAISSDSKFLFLHTYDWGREWVEAITTKTGELMYELHIHTATKLVPGFPGHVSLSQDDSILLICKPSFYLSIINASNGHLIRKLDVGSGFVPRRLSLDTDTQQLHTNLGSFDLYKQFLDGTNYKLFFNERSIEYGFSSDRSWILWKNKKVFWLPPDFRPWEHKIEISGSTIIFGTKTGLVIRYKFDIDKLLSAE